VRMRTGLSGANHPLSRPRLFGQVWLGTLRCTTRSGLAAQGETGRDGAPTRIARNSPVGTEGPHEPSRKDLLMSRVASRFLVVAIATLLATGSLSSQPQPATAATPTDLFFSEYIEGSSNNKALEIYNGTGASIDLAADGFNVQMFFNGNPVSTLTINLTGSVADGAVFVLAQSAAHATILAQADQTNGSGWFNGDDAVVLRKGTTILDAVGQIGFDPGTEWGTGLTSTADNTLRRMSTACAGDPDGSNAFDPATEWDGFAQDTFDGLGAHTANCDDAPGLSIDDVTAFEGNSGTTSFDFTVSLSAPAGPGGVTFDISTADGSATAADNDYVATSLTGQTIAAGDTTFNFSATVNGDTATEPGEQFFVNVTNVTGAAVTDGQGVGTILSDDCSPTFTPIYEIQGSGLATPIPGNVTTQGIVVGDYEGSTGLQGFYMQDVAGDDDPTTSDGIFVFTGSADVVDAGDLVRVSGFARERFNQTAINGSNSNSSAVPALNIAICGPGEAITPVDVELPFSSSTFLERFEGMLVRFPQALVISEYFNYDRFGEIVLALPLEGESRHFTPTSVVEPGDPAIDRLAEYLLRRITLDDGLSVQNPEFTRHPNGDGFGLDNTFRGGDTVANTVGVLGFDFSLYRIQPTAPADYTSVNPRPETPEDVGGDLKVASMNMLNFFVTLDAGPDICGPAQNVECRGADNGEEFDRQREKLVAALAGLNADVVGLNEIENTTGADALGDPDDGIVAGLNDTYGAGAYAAIDTGVIGSDTIAVGFIYKPAVVTPVGDFAILDSTVDPRFDDDFSRPALAQTFEENATGERFTVVVNHLKSKGSACPGDPDLGDGQGNCNLTRLAAAQALVDWLATDPTGSGDPDFLITGDLNSYAMEDPIDAIKAGPDDVAGTEDDYTNLIAQFQGAHAYSFVFDGQAGYLDHALSNASLTGQVTGATEWHINADEPDLLDYDTSFKSATQDTFFEPNAYRSSDHDPVLLGLDLNAPPTIAVVAGGTCTPAGTGGTVNVVVGDLQTAPGDLELTLDANTNTALVRNAGVALGGGGANRTITVSPTSGVSGTAVLTFGLSDGINTTEFVLTVIVGRGAAETLNGTSGADLMLGLGGADTLNGGDGADLLCGGNGADTLNGDDGDDTLNGGRGADDLSGGEGDDVLRGGQGDDTLTGGAGADEFSGGPGGDTLTDVTPADGDTTDGT